MGDQLRIFFATDIHGSDRCFRKFVNAGKFYGVDALVMGGDITGKMLVPIVRVGAGAYEAELFGQHRRFTEDGLPAVRKLIGDAGYYPYEADRDELEELHASPDRVESAFREVMTSTLRTWTELAAERLAGTQIQCFLSPGNDDHPFVDALLRDAEGVVNPEERVVEMPAGFVMVSVGSSNVTPWHSPRELPENELAELIEGVAREAPHPARTIFNLHVPPRDTPLDQAFMLRPDLSPVMRNGSPVVGGVGSSAVRGAIERHQPVLALHGHIHESRGLAKIGRTSALNPGSEYSDGVLRGVIVTLESGKGLRSHQFVAG